MKALTDSQFALKAAVRRAVKAAGGPSAAAEVVRVDAARLSRYGNVDAPEFAPVDVAFGLDNAAGDHVVLRAWADLCGFDLVERNSEAKLAADLTTIAGKIARGSGELVDATIEANADHKITPGEATNVLNAASDLKGVVVEIERVARRAAGAA